MTDGLQYGLPSKRMPASCRYCGIKRHVQSFDEDMRNWKRDFACGVEFMACSDGPWWSDPNVVCVDRLRIRLGMKRVKR